VVHFGGFEKTSSYFEGTHETSLDLVVLGLVGISVVIAAVVVALVVELKLCLAEIIGPVVEVEVKPKVEVRYFPAVASERNCRPTY
jgi:hypothetical protein